MAVLNLRRALPADLAALDALEQASFATDRLSRRRLRHWIRADNGLLWVAEDGVELLGYGLVLFHGASRLARLYSIAVAASARGRGVATRLLQALEAEAAGRGCFIMRLEVAEDNRAAITLYRQAGYGPFDTVADYYEDHRSALRMQKVIRAAPSRVHGEAVPWYQQTTHFTCGPAALMMAMAALDPAYRLSQAEELQIWREATTIFMTSGHGGCHPLGLALAAQRRGFHVETWINRRGTLFAEGVRQDDKKHILALVHQQFAKQARQQALKLRYRDISQDVLQQWLDSGGLAVVLISSYQLDRKKAPHWVTVTTADEECFYLHDPDPSVEEQTGLDCENIPIARQDFSRMSQFGRDRLRTALLLRRH